MGAFCCHGNQSFDLICPKTLCSLSPTPVMLHIKFDQDWPTGFRDIQVWKCGWRMDDRPLVYYKLTLWAFGSGELKTWGLFFADFNFCGLQHPWKIILILPRKSKSGCRGSKTRLSLDRSTVPKENLRPKYLKCMGMKDTCSLTDKQIKQTYIHSDGWIKWLFRTKQWNVCLACVVTWTLKVVSYDTFCHKTTCGVFWI